MKLLPCVTVLLLILPFSECFLQGLFRASAAGSTVASELEKAIRLHSPRNSRGLTAKCVTGWLFSGNVNCNISAYSTIFHGSLDSKNVMDQVKLVSLKNMFDYNVTCHSTTRLASFFSPQLTCKIAMKPSNLKRLSFQLFDIYSSAESLNKNGGKSTRECVSLGQGKMRCTFIYTPYRKYDAPQSTRIASEINGKIDKFIQTSDFGHKTTCTANPTMRYVGILFMKAPGEVRCTSTITTCRKGFLGIFKHC